MEEIPDHIIERIDYTINKYGLFNENEAIVAYSGGKDSLYLCKALVQLGYRVHPIIIDIGYDVLWDRAIDNANSIGLKAELIDINTIQVLFPGIYDSIRSYFQNVLDIRDGKYPKASPCTPCHNAKMTVLSQWSIANGVKYVATGHHGTDAIASMLKSFFMYLDRWEKENVVYDYDNFVKLIEEYKPIFQKSKEDFLNTDVYTNITDLISKKKVSTDEAIIHNIDERNLFICRPMYNVFENDILEYYKTNQIDVGITECFLSHIRNEGLLTPREIVQYEIVRNANPNTLNVLLDLANQCLDESGRLLFNVRNNRRSILGDLYKDETVNVYKK